MSPRPPRSPHAGRPADVIALSPFRAELGRARRLRRAEALYEARDLGEAVRQLPGDELFYVLHELGLQDGRELLTLATPEQVQVVLDFALWHRDQMDGAALGQWLEAMVAAPFEQVGAWLEGLDSELVGLILRRGARIYDLSLEEPPDEPEGTLFPTPDGLFVLDVVGVRDLEGTSALPADGDADDPSAVLIRLVDAFYRADLTAARRMLIGARSELDSELEESAYRWRQARMADLGFADHYEALEVYREVDLGLSAEATGEGAEAATASLRPSGTNASDGVLRVPSALAERLRDTGSRFARAAQQLADAGALETLRTALATLTNRVLAADRVSPGNDDAVATAIERLLATLDLGLEQLTGGSDELAPGMLRSIPLERVFRVGFSLTARVRRLALALRRGGPFGPQGFRLAEPDDATVLEAVVRPRPLFPRLLDDPPRAGERPFGTLADVATAAAAVERAAVAQAMLHALGVTAEDVVIGSPLLTALGDDEAALDTGLLARTVLVARLSPGAAGGTARTPRLHPLTPEEIAAFESQLRPRPTAKPELPPALAGAAMRLLESSAPAGLSRAAASVAARWIAGLAPLEPVIRAVRSD